MRPVASASDAVPIYTDNDFYVPAFTLKIGARSQDQSILRDVIQVTYKDDIKEIGSFDMIVNNWDAEKRTFKYSDSKQFDPGQQVELSMGYHLPKHMRVMLRGLITSMTPNFPAGGKPTLAIKCLNALHRFRTEQRSDRYIQKTDLEIARDICRRLKIELFTKKPEGQGTRHEYLLQDQQFDIVFLMNRARRIGYDLFVTEREGKTGMYFGPSDNVKKVTYRLTYGKSLIDFQPTLTTALQVSKVTVLGWDAKQGKPIKVTKDRSALKKESMNKEQLKAVNSSFADREEIINDIPVRDEKEATELALARLKGIISDMVKGRGTVVGLPDLRSGSVIFLEGLGASDLPSKQRRFDGRYFVTSTTHTIGSSGYTTKFECRREELK
ncbi:MAG: phage late control D family protein [Gemmataceae bacterium]